MIENLSNYTEVLIVLITGSGAYFRLTYSLDYLTKTSEGQKVKIDELDKHVVQFRIDKNHLENKISISEKQLEKLTNAIEKLNEKLDLIINKT